MSEVRVCSREDVDAGDVRGFDLVDNDGQAHAVAVIHSESDAWYAIADRCTHGRIKLSEGWVEGETIECSRHGAAFDLASGAVVTPPASIPVATYPIRVAESDIYITL